MRLSISIVTINNKKLVEDCLDSIYRYTEGILFKVFVLDNNSGDGTASMIKEKFPQVELIEIDKRQSYTANQNIILRRIKTEYVLVLNNDTIFLDNSLKTMVDFLDSNPHIGAVACKILNADGSFQSTCIRRDMDLLSMFSVKTGLFRLFPKSRIWGRPNMGYADRDAIQEVEVFSGACVMLRKKVLDDVGLLDENIKFGPDDHDLSYRMRKRGWKIYYLPMAKVVHLFGQTRKVNPETYLEEVRGIFYLYLKHYGRLKTLLLKLLFIHGCFLKTLAWSYLYVANKITKVELSHNLKVHAALFKLVISYPCTRNRVVRHKFT